jgi:hypothetical protein
MANNKTIQALKALGEIKRIPEEERARFKRQIMGKSDRLVAILSTSLIEIMLTHLIQSVMPNGPGQLFDPNYPLSTFSSKIDLAYSLNLINHEIKTMAHYTRHIRNIFAHSIMPVAFTTPQIAAVCRLLPERKNDRTRSMRKRFLSASLDIADALMKRFDVKSSLGEPPASLQ